MNWDSIDWNNFSCVDMTRKIKDEIDTEIADMTTDELMKYLHDAQLNFNKSLSVRKTQKK